MPFLLYQGDITQLKVDAIVNADDSNVQMGGSFTGSNAGELAMQQASGNMVITPASNLPCKHVIHSVRPVWEELKGDGTHLLSIWYQKVLALAQEKGLKSIAFPLVTSEANEYPKDRAYETAVSAILSFLDTSDMTVYLVLRMEILSKDADLHKKKLDRYVRRHLPCIDEVSEILCCMNVCRSVVSEPLEGIITEVEASFSQSLMKLIREKGLDEVEVYKKANIDRKHFSKIRSNDGYQPTKRTVIAFAISLKLNAQQTRDLLQSSGFSLSHSYVFDIIIEYFIEKKLYDIHTINEALFTYEQPLLGA